MLENKASLSFEEMKDLEMLLEYLITIHEFSEINENGERNGD